MHHARDRRHLVKPVSLLDDDGWRQDNCERETEFLGTAARHAEGQRGGNGCAGSGQAAKWQTQTLNDTDPYGTSDRQFASLLPPPGRVKNEQSCGRQASGHDLWISEQVFDLESRRILSYDALD